MRWKIRVEPRVGDKRERYPFALFPTKIGTHMVWLERYWIEEELQDVAVFDEGQILSERRWVEVQRGLPWYYV